MRSKMLCLVVALCLAVPVWGLAASPAPAEDAAPKVVTYGKGVLYDGIPLANGGFLLVGATHDDPCDALALWTNAKGEVLLESGISSFPEDGDTTPHDIFTDAVALPDGNFGILLNTSSAKSSSYKLLIVDSTGEEVRQMKQQPEGVGFISNEGPAFEVLVWHLLSDGILVQRRTTVDENDWQHLNTLTRMDFDGNVLWQREYPDMLPWIIHPWSSDSIVQDGDSLYLTGIWREAQEYAACVARLDGEGNVEWTYAMEPTGYSHFTGLGLLPDGSLLLCGSETTIQNDNDKAFLTRLDAEGKLVSQAYYEEADFGRLQYFFPVDDGFLAVRSRFVEKEQTSDLVRLGADGDIQSVAPLHAALYETTGIHKGPDGKLYVFSGPDMTVTALTLPEL